LAHKKNELYPNPRTNIVGLHAYATERESLLSHMVLADAYYGAEIERSLNWYRFIGRILGKAMYEGILVDVAFAEFFLAKVCMTSHVYSAKSC
jgi:ubiquitin-protein ligase E3 C